MDFQFHETFPEDSDNGLIFNGKYLPEEVVLMILSYVEPKQILKTTLVCKKWCNIVKSTPLWSQIYSRKKNKKPKKLPWYVYYALFATNYLDCNLLRNGNGEEQFKHWEIVKNYGDAFRVEKTPVGSQPLPEDVPDFRGNTGCFATSYYECNKIQTISLENKRLLRLILNNFQPHIYVSEWVAPRFDCGSTYFFKCRLCGEKKKPPKDEFDEDYSYADLYDEEGCQIMKLKTVEKHFQQWQGGTWEKLETIISDYLPGVFKIVFEHEGRDTQFWKGHYGCKMAGGVIKILFDSIEPK